MAPAPAETDVCVDDGAGNPVLSRKARRAIREVMDRFDAGGTGLLTRHQFHEMQASLGDDPIDGDGWIYLKNHYRFGTPPDEAALKKPQAALDDKLRAENIAEAGYEKRRAALNSELEKQVAADQKKADFFKKTPKAVRARHEQQHEHGQRHKRRQPRR